MKNITITLTEEQWADIYGEAMGHLSYWGAECESVDKLSHALNIHKEHYFEVESLPKGDAKPKWLASADNEKELIEECSELEEPYTINYWREGKHVGTFANLEEYEKGKNKRPDDIERSFHIVCKKCGEEKVSLGATHDDYASIMCENKECVNYYEE